MACAGLVRGHRLLTPEPAEVPEDSWSGTLLMSLSLSAGLSSAVINQLWSWWVQSSFSFLSLVIFVLLSGCWFFSWNQYLDMFGISFWNSDWLWLNIPIWNAYFLAVLCYQKSNKISWSQNKINFGIWYKGSYIDYETHFRGEGWRGYSKNLQSIMEGVHHMCYGVLVIGRWGPKQWKIFCYVNNVWPLSSTMPTDTLTYSVVH